MPAVIEYISAVSTDDDATTCNSEIKLADIVPNCVGLTQVILLSISPIILNVNVLLDLTAGSSLPSLLAVIVNV